MSNFNRLVIAGLEEPLQMYRNEYIYFELYKNLVYLNVDSASLKVIHQSLIKNYYSLYKTQTKKLIKNVSI